MRNQRFKLRRALRVGPTSTEAIAVFSSAVEAFAAAFALYALVVCISISAGGDRNEPHLQVKQLSQCTLEINTSTQMNSQTLTYSCCGRMEKEAFNFSICQSFLKVSTKMEINISSNNSVVEEASEQVVAAFVSLVKGAVWGNLCSLIGYFHTGCFETFRYVTWASSATYAMLAVARLLLVLRFVRARFVLHGSTGFQSCHSCGFDHSLPCRVGALVWHGTGLFALLTLLSWIQFGGRYRTQLPACLTS
jgi:hypothetical protein